MLPAVDAILMVLFLAGLIGYVLIGRRGGNDAEQHTPAAPTPIGLRPDRGPVEDRVEAPASRPRPLAQQALLAALVSFLAPGLGHFLIGARLRGALFLAGWVVLAVASGALHSPVALVWMIVAGIDAYWFARSHKDPTDPTGAAPTSPPR